MKKKNQIWPQYVKNSKGKVTHAYLPIDAYDAIKKELKEYEEIKKSKGIRWVQISKEKSLKKK